MQVFNILDDKNRFQKLKFYSGKDGQADSHGASYLYLREQRQKLYGTMGLEKPCLDPLYRALDNGMEMEDFVEEYRKLADDRDD